MFIRARGSGVEIRVFYRRRLNFIAGEVKLDLWIELYFEVSRKEVKLMLTEGEKRISVKRESTAGLLLDVVELFKKHSEVKDRDAVISLAVEALDTADKLTDHLFAEKIEKAKEKILKGEVKVD